MFSNAESVYIRNKEVASIVTADGGVLYQKDSGYDLLLTCDNPILSFNDGDACTLSGVLTFNGVVVPDEPIDYNIMHDGTVLDSGSLTTDDNGEINLNYIAAGVGDVDVVFSLRSLLQKTFVIEDLYHYDTTIYSTSSVTLNVPLPSTFELEYVIKQTNSNAGVPYLDIGDSSNNRMLVGQYARAGTNGIITYTGTQNNYPYSSNPTLNQDNTIHFKYDGTNYVYWLNDGTPMTISDKGILLSKLIHIEGGGNSNNLLKDIKVKAL